MIDGIIVSNNRIKLTPLLIPTEINKTYTLFVVVVGPWKSLDSGLKEASCVGATRCIICTLFVLSSL